MASPPKRMRDDLVHPSQLPKPIKKQDSKISKISRTARITSRVRKAITGNKHHEVGAAQPGIKPEPEVTVIQSYHFEMVERQVSSSTYCVALMISRLTGFRSIPLPSERMSSSLRQQHRLSQMSKPKTLSVRRRRIPSTTTPPLRTRSRRARTGTLSPPTRHITLPQRQKSIAP